MKHAFYAAAGWLLSTALLYSAIAFTTFNANPGEWGSPARGLLGFGSAALLIVAFAIWVFASLIPQEVE